jgi:hypothetical protein
MNSRRIDANAASKKRPIGELSDGSRMIIGEDPTCCCGHRLASHYVQQDWPACSECDSCRGFMRVKDAK